MENGPREGRDGSAKKELCNDVEAMHNLHFLAAIEIAPESNAAMYLHRLKRHLDRVTDALCR
jgi:hypothetical protein